MVEVGYAIDPAERRKGHAKAALGILLDVARMDDRVRVVRASVALDNVGSRQLIEGVGFDKVGEIWDEDDEVWEEVWELSVDGGEVT